MGRNLFGALARDAVGKNAGSRDHPRSRETTNLARREADLAVRHHPPQGGNLYVAKLGTFGCAVYRRRGAEGEGC
jgi:hypothetical protein